MEVNILSKNNNNVAIICASGARSKIVSDYLINEGYENIYNIPDGIIGKKSDGAAELQHLMKYQQKINIVNHAQKQ